MSRHTCRQGEGVAGGEVRRQGGQQGQWPPLALLYHGQVQEGQGIRGRRAIWPGVPGLLALTGVPGGAAEEPLDAPWKSSDRHHGGVQGLCGGAEGKGA